MSNVRRGLGIAAMFVACGLLAAAAAKPPYIGVKKTSAGDVTLVLTPESVDDKALRLRLELTTHTVDGLDKVEFQKIFTLTLGSQSVAPTGVPKIGGHHSSGALVFPVAAVPAAFAVRFGAFPGHAAGELSWP